MMFTSPEFQKSFLRQTGQNAADLTSNRSTA